MRIIYHKKYIPFSYENDKTFCCEEKVVGIYHGISIFLVGILSMPIVYGQQPLNNTATLPQESMFSFIITVRGLTEYNEDKLAVVIMSGNLIESKIVDRSKAVLPPGQSEEPFSNEPRMVDTEIDFSPDSGMKAGDEFQACILSLGDQYQSIQCQIGVVNPPSAGPQRIIIPL